MVFTIRYAIPMNGPGCQRSVSNKLLDIEGVNSIDVDLPQQEVVINGEVAPSLIVKNMQEIGRDAFVRGSGAPNSAAVAILETNAGAVKGLARLIEVAQNKVLFDVTVDSSYANTAASVYSFGDISNPPKSLGSLLFNILRIPSPKSTESTASGWATIGNTPLADLIGRSVHTDSGLTGIVARSAGLWENDKTVCTCSGKTVWEERKDFREHTSGNL